ncbi:hypothetical protein C8R42DRAFT_117762 [Lentinula raphanica]|nr:hypothetical protein C8R42DRAFT_117762 [Lentinula raphanica]
MDTLCSYIDMLDTKSIPESKLKEQKESEYFRIGDHLSATSLSGASRAFYPIWNVPPIQHSLGSHLFDSLPTEMIIMIFSFCDISAANLLETNDGTWVLTQVCKRWRDIVVHCPLFWTRVNLDLSCWHYTQNRPNRADMLVETFLERSKDMPLDVQIHCPDIQGAPNHILTAVEHLLNASPRWRLAMLDLPYTVYQALSPVIYGRLDLLESLYLKFDLPHKTTRNFFSGIDAFQIAPKLCQVSIEGLPYATKNVRLPWNQVTHLNAYHDFPNPNYHCLRLSSNLVECHISSRGDLLESPRGAYAPVSLPHLKRLFVEGTGALILPYLVAHNTEVLHVTNVLPGTCSEECIDAVQEFIVSESGCSESLKDLALHSDPLDYRVAEILFATRELVKLSLRLSIPNGSSLFVDLLKWLSYRDVPRSSLTSCTLGLLPRLADLSMRIECSSAGIEGDDVEALVRMLESRRTMPQVSESHRGFSQLESFDLEVKACLPTLEAGVFNALNEMGLRTSMKLVR